MRTPMVPKKEPTRRAIARSSDGRVIDAAQVHHPAENVSKAWNQTEKSLREAIDTCNTTRR